MLEQQIPTLSQLQERWLRTAHDDQIAAAGNRYTGRAIEATNSVEYQISVAKPRTVEPIDAFTRIATGNVPDTKEEIAL
jgi:hypothetical protein